MDKLYDSLRKTSDNPTFPWHSPLVPLICIDFESQDIMTAKSKTEKRRLFSEGIATGENVILLAAWPGEWSQDVFLVDNPADCYLAII